jgi:hypothetical protein
VVVEGAGDPVPAVLPVEPVVDPLVFVVAAPERQGGMGAQARHLVARLRLDFGDELGCLRVGGAGKHEVLPDQKAEPVAEVVEGVVLVDAAAPDPDHVHVRLARLDKQELVAPGVERTHEGVGRDPVRALGEEGNAVQDEAEEAGARLIGIRRLVQFQAADAHLLRPAIEPQLAAVFFGEQHRLQLVEMRLPELVRPP